MNVAEKGGIQMYWVIGAITILGLLAGVYTFFKKSKINGITQLIVAVICPIITIMFCSLKDKHAFGGTDWEFLLHSATVDAEIWPWIALVLLIVEIIFIIKAVFMALKRNN